MDRDLKYTEFYAQGGQAGNAGWFTGLASKDRLLTITTINRTIPQWYLYSYLWIQAASNGATLKARLSFYDGTTLISTLNLAYMAADAAGQALITANFKQSLSNVAISSTTDEANALGIILASPQAKNTYGADEPTGQFFLKPQSRIGGFTRVDLDILSMTNCAPDTIRAILALRPV